MIPYRDSPSPHQVMVILGQPDDALIASLRALGMAPIMGDDHVVIWRRRLQPIPASIPRPEPPHESGPAGLLMTITDAALALGMGRSSTYELIGRGQLEVVHIGRSARVPTDALRALVERLRAEQGSDDWRRAAG